MASEGARPAVPRRYDAVLFDVGGTLVDDQDPLGYAAIAEALGLEGDPDAMVHALRQAEETFDRPGPRPSAEAYWAVALAGLAGHPVPEATVGEFVARYRRLTRSPHLYSDVRRTLDRLAFEGRRLGVVSNSRSAPALYELLGTVGILGHFATVVSSGTEGIAKPDPEIFRRAAQRIGVAPARAFYVGDLPYTDAKAAAVAGLGAVWLHRDGTGFGDDPPEITSLTELPGWIARLEAALVK
ncbi:MAG TPA: HAD-IA family hydrolase [Thermoplasmata archaeon]|nr:HAD-IA family hydrolase [Thermoplasmata archaeon]